MPSLLQLALSSILRILHHRPPVSTKPTSPTRSVGDGSCEKQLISEVRSDSDEEVHEDECMVGVPRCCSSDESYNRHGFAESAVQIVRLRG